MSEYYTSYDLALLADKLTTHLAFLTMSWRNLLGRPTVTLVATSHYIGKFANENLSTSSDTIACLNN